MIASMTAYGRQALQKEWGQATWEIRSVNHRYLDLSFKIPEYCREWENEWRTLIGNQIHRGKVECYLSFLPSRITAQQLKINTDLVEKLLLGCQTLASYAEISPVINVMELLAWPEVLMPQAPDLSPLREPLTSLLNQTLQDLVKTRMQEGNHISEILRAKLNQVLTYVDLIKERVPLCVQTQKQRLKQKILEIPADFDEQRLEQEIVLFAQKSDIEEEVARLETHVKAVLQALSEKGAIGRRLDFLMQEMNREANTLASKSPDNHIISAAIELKVLIEQMREQIQNLE
ncbi:MAG: YicC family protein [Proteobacteria bacterium]|nr:YicC family protein [Pseudomonadota bacterium]